MRLKMAPDHTNIQFLNYKNIAIVLSLAMMVLSAGLFFTRGLNLGIDFVGGIMIEVGTEQEVPIEDYRSIIEGLSLGNTSVQEFRAVGQQDQSSFNVMIRIERQLGDEAAGISVAQAQQITIQRVQDTIDRSFEDPTFRRVEVVGPVVSEELKAAGILSVLLAVTAVLIYIWIRFEWHFGVGAVAALVHDVLLTIGFFSLTGLEFNLSIIAAILTIVGYSLNDTVVVFDRVRVNLRNFRSFPL